MSEREGEIEKESKKETEREKEGMGYSRGKERKALIMRLRF